MDWRRPIADPESDIGILRLNWITANQFMDRKEETEEKFELAKMHGFWTNPHWYYQVHKEVGKTMPAEELMRIGQITVLRQNNFDKKLQAAVTGKEMREDRSDVADRVRMARGKRPARGEVTELDEALIAEEPPRR